MSVRMLFWCSLVLLSSFTPAKAQNSYDLVRGMYTKFLHREPAPQEITTWTDQLRRGLSVNEMTANILGSDEYYRIHGNANEAYITGLYSDVLNRRPAPQEVASHLDGLRRLGRNRVQFARNFLSSAQHEIAGNNPPTWQPRPPQGNNIGRALVNQTNLLVTTVQREQGGTFQGRQLLIRANNLNYAARQYESAVGSGNINSIQQTLSNVQQSLNEFESQLAVTPGVAPVTQNMAYQIEQTVRQAWNTIPGSPSIPTPPVGPGFPGKQWRKVRSSVDDLTLETQRLVIQLQGFRNPDFFHQGLLRDAQNLNSQVDRLRLQLNQGIDPNSLGRSFSGILNQANYMNQTIRGGRPEWRLRQQWYTTSNAITNLQQLLQSMNIPINDPGTPIIVNPPAFPETSFPIYRPNPGLSNRAIVQQIDTTMNQLNAVMAELTPRLHTTPYGPVLQSQANGFANSLSQFRQLAQSGASDRQIRSAFQQLSNEYAQMQGTYNTMVRVSPGLSTYQQFASMVESLRRLVS